MKCWDTDELRYDISVSPRIPWRVANVRMTVVLQCWALSPIYDVATNWTLQRASQFLSCLFVEPITEQPGLEHALIVHPYSNIDIIRVVGHSQKGYKTTFAHYCSQQQQQRKINFQTPLNPKMAPAIPKDSLVLVTGINGYLGSHVADQFLEAGYRVRGTTRDLKKVDGLKSIGRKSMHPAGLNSCW